MGEKEIEFYLECEVYNHGDYDIIVDEDISNPMVAGAYKRSYVCSETIYKPYNNIQRLTYTKDSQGALILNAKGDPTYTWVKVKEADRIPDSWWKKGSNHKVVESDSGITYSRDVEKIGWFVKFDSLLQFISSMIGESFSLEGFSKEIDGGCWKLRITNG